ncbi:LCP family protein [Candidatus Uhrbacteria bacterium]|nr:LCP family protein [Candidatus Uhrbacteria bacterium]
MNPVKINLLNGTRIPNPTGKGRKGNRAFLVFAMILMFSVSFGLGRLSLTETAAAALTRLDDIPIFRQMHLIASPDRRLLGEAEDRINILLLGMGGKGHDGPMLTDTIIVASIRPSDSRVAMLSIPRDLLAPIEGRGWQKINAANAYGESAEEGSGADLARTTVEGLLGMEIPYHVRIDFSGFRKIIDDLGGVEIDVERDFTDYSYPTDSHGYQAVSFRKGTQLMDGETALKYSRSRHGNNGEGSDFSRAKRQQKVLLALKDQLLTLKFLRNPATVSSLLSDVRDNFRTNLQLGEILRLAKIGRAVDPGQIVHKVIGDGPDSPLMSASVNGAYVLVPRNSDWNGLRQLALGLFGETSDIVAAPKTATETAKNDDPPEAVQPSEIRLEILNGTTRTGLAANTAKTLETLGYRIHDIGNASNQARSRTAIQDLTGGKMAGNIEDLAKRLGTADPEISVSPAPSGTGKPSADILIILGRDVPN